MNFLRSCWYKAAWADDLLRGERLVRMYLDEPVLIFRDEAGAPHAPFDRSSTNDFG